MIIPAHNAETTIDRTLASLTAQGMAEWEAIVVDDGSTDGTWARLSLAQDERIRAVRQVNAGVSAARNCGLELASAPYVLFLDADDTIEPDHLGGLLAALDGRDDAVAYCGYKRVTSAGSLLQPVLASELADNPFETLCFSNRLATHGLLIPHTAFERVGTFDTGLRTCEDWDLWARLARAGYAFRQVASVGAIYRMRGDSLSRDFARLAEDAHAVLRRCREPDPRVRSPKCEFAGGYPGDLRVASAILRLWCATAALAAGQDRDLSFDAVTGVDLAGHAELLTATIRDGLAIGGEAEPQALARIWNRIRARLSPVLDTLTAHSSEAGLKHRVVYSLERDLVRDDPLDEPLRLECVDAVRRTAEDLRPVTTDADLVHLRIYAQSEEKLREELPGWTMLDRKTLHDKAKAAGAFEPDHDNSAKQLADPVSEIETVPAGTAPPPARSGRGSGMDPCGEPGCQLVETRTIPILMYRSIGGAPGLAQASVSPAAFEAQLSLLRRHGFDALNTSQLAIRRRSAAPMPGRAVIITFDGGCRGFYEHAWPALDRHAYSADVFVPVAKIGETSDAGSSRKGARRHMNWQEIVELSARGIGFGTQLMTGTHIDGLTSAELFDEALRSRLILGRRLGKEVRAVAAPSGEIDERAIWTFDAAGYYVGLSAKRGLASLDGHPLDLPRIEVRGGMALEDFARAVEIPCRN